jgi:thioredoxin-related protein
MPRPLRFALPALLLLLATSPARALEWKSWNSGLQAGHASGRPVLVDVYTDWCGWCKRMDRDVYARADVAGYLSSHFVLVRLNAESGELTTYQGRTYSARSLAGTFDVSGYPTTIFLGPEGDRLATVPGYLEGDRFMLLLRYIGDGHLQRKEPWEQFVKREQGGH